MDRNPGPPDRHLSAGPCNRQPASALKTTTAPFAGTRSGSTATLTFTQGFLGYTDTRIWTGTLSGDTLKLTWPLASGGLNTVSYTRSSPEAYNAAVTRLSREVDAARTQFAQHQEKARGADGY